MGLSQVNYFLITRYSLLLAFFIIPISFPAKSQELTRPLSGRIIVKTNLLNLIAQGPSISIEKTFLNTFSAEFSYVQGKFNDALLAKHYDYNGFLLRAKKSFIKMDFGNVCPYAAIYAGNLNRNIETEGISDRTGFFSIRGRDFSANSIRTGGSLGVAYYTKSKFVIDMQGSLGYGRYLNIHDKNKDEDIFSNGYLDAQTWISVGYCF